MKLKLYLLLLALCSQFTSFSQTLDQSATVVSTQLIIHNPGQSFVAGIQGALSKIGFYYYNYNNNFDYKLLIYSGAGNSGTLLATQLFSTNSATPNGEFEVAISTNVTVIPGNTYTVYISAQDNSASGIGVGTSNSYSAGSLYLDSTSQENLGWDMWFKTYVTQTPATHLNFDGIDDLVELPSIIEPNLRNNVTVEFWMKSSTTPDQGDVLFAQGEFGLGLSLNNDGTVQFSGSGGFQTINSTAVVTDGEWHHVAGTFFFNGTTTNASLYIDGVLDNSTTAYENGQISYSSSALTIGANSVVTNRNYEGSIEDLRIWNVARTASEINVNKACELTGAETDLLAYYTFNQGFDVVDNSNITSLTDATANAYNGTFNNMLLIGSTSNFIAEAVMQTPTAPTVITPINYILGATATALTVTATTTVLWYNVATGGTALSGAPTPSTTVLGSTSYWVSSINAKGCESDRTEIVVIVNPILPATYLNFDGVDDFVSLPNESNFDFTNQMTVEFWIKSDITPTQWDAIVAKGDDSWRITLNANGTVNFAGSNGFGDVSSGTNVIDNVWHHVAVTYNGTIAFIYVDGYEDNSVFSTGDINNSNSEVTIGENSQVLGRNYTGNLDDVRIWNIAKPGAEINVARNCALQGNEPGLVAYYKFNQGNGGEDNTAITSLIDATGNNNGTFNGFALNGNTSNFLAADTPLPNLGYTFTKSDVSCNGLNDGSIAVSVYGGQGPYTFAWSNGSSNSTINNLSAGTYSLHSITDANGCLIGNSNPGGIGGGSTLELITIMQPSSLGNPTVTTPVSYNQNDTATALTATTGTNGTGLIWFTTETGGNGDTVAPTPSTATVGNTSYWVASTSAIGCESGRTEIVVTVESQLSTSNFEMANNIKMYPNPINNLVTVEVKNLTNAILQVVDISGKILINQSLNTSSNTVNVSQLPTGLYFFKVSSNEGEATSKIIKN